MRQHTMILAVFTMLIATAATGPVDAGRYVGVAASNHGLSLGFGTANWGIWGSSWASGNWSFGFSTALSGYGEWVHLNGLGSVWRPWVASGWQPYTHGRWVWTSMGWTWVAYEPWGWVPHHYGNWAFTTIGWVWSPGYTYHPGNVVWVSSGLHIGWYPYAPHGWSHFHRGYHHGWNQGYSHGYADGWRDARYATWVPWTRIGTDNVSHHAVGHEVAVRAVPRSRVTALDVAPTRQEVERRTGRSVPETRIIEREATVDGRTVRVARPEGQAGHVQRHGGATVERALAPTARKRATGEATREARVPDSSDQRVYRRPRSDSVKTDAGPSGTVRHRDSTTRTPTGSRGVKNTNGHRVERGRPASSSTGNHETPNSRRSAESTGSRPSTKNRAASPESPNTRRVAESTVKSRGATRPAKQPAERASGQRRAPTRKTALTTEAGTSRTEPQKAEQSGKKNRRSRPAKD